MRNKPYFDHLGYETIGVGHLMDKAKGGSLPDWAQQELNQFGQLSNKTINRLLEEDVIKAVKDLNREIPWATTLSEVRYGVLLDMTFQMGIGRKPNKEKGVKGTGLQGFQNTLAMIERGDYAGAAEGMKNSAWYKQTPNRCNRRREEMRSNVYHKYPE